MILFVGDKPSAKMKPEARAFEGAACEARLMEWIAYLTDMAPLEILLLEERVEESPHHKDGSSFRFFHREFIICNAVDNLLPSIVTVCAVHNEPIIALGQAASKRINRDHFVLPHPSGRNRQLNNKDFIAKKLEECKLWLKEQQKK